MNRERLEMAAKGYTEDQEGNKYYFTSPAPGIHVYDNVWPDSLNFFNNLLDENFWEENKNNPGYKKWSRKDFFNNIEYKEEDEKQIDTCLIHSHPDPNNAFSGPVKSYLWHWNLDPQSRESLRISRFSNGDFSGYHSDDTLVTPRTISIVYYPNDDYDGGELEFLHFGLTIKPKAKQLFIFPSSYAYEHEIKEITGGNPRMTMVSFLYFGTETENVFRRQGIKMPYKPKFIDLFDIK